MLEFQLYMDIVNSYKMTYNELIFNLQENN